MIYFSRRRQYLSWNIRSPSFLVRSRFIDQTLSRTAPSWARNPVRGLPQTLSSLRFRIRRLHSYCFTRNGLQVRLTFWTLIIHIHPLTGCFIWRSALFELCFIWFYFDLYLTIIVIICSDLLQNPTIVPLKVLRGHERFDDFGVLDVLFHPTQPWLFTSGADSTIRLYTWSYTAFNKQLHIW